MRVFVDQASGQIIQVSTEGLSGDTVPVNGQYALDLPATLNVDSSSYVTPVDGGDLSSLAFEQFRQEFVTFDNVVFNTFVSPSDINALDTSGTVDNTAGLLISTADFDNIFEFRGQIGRGTGPASVGLASGSVAMLPANLVYTFGVSKAGCLITDTIDISAQTGGLGADLFAVYWKVHKYTTSHDVRSSYGSTNGQNEAAVRSLLDIDQELSGLFVGISTDDGGSYVPVSRMKNYQALANSTTIRLCFLNTTSEKIYLNSYALLF